jgi:hypothetical protein
MAPSTEYPMLLNSTVPLPSERTTKFTRNMLRSGARLSSCRLGTARHCSTGKGLVKRFPKPLITDQAGVDILHDPLWYDRTRNHRRALRCRTDPYQVQGHGV